MQITITTAVADKLLTVLGPLSDDDIRSFVLQLEAAKAADERHRQRRDSMVSGLSESQAAIYFEPGDKVLCKDVKDSRGRSILRGQFAVLINREVEVAKMGRSRVHIHVPEFISDKNPNGIVTVPIAYLEKVS